MKTTKIRNLNEKLQEKRTEPNYELVGELVYYVHKNWCKHKFPIDLDFIYKFKNLKVKTYTWFANLNNLSLEETINYINSDSGCCWYIPTEKKYLILYNDHIDNACHNRWTLAHELGHYLLKHNEICNTAVLGRNSLCLKEYQIYEKEANAFARELLAPLNVICTTLDNFSVMDIMDLCDLSYEASSYIFNYIVNGLKMGISHKCESKTTDIFKTFINNYKNLKSCVKCNYNLVKKEHDYCSICGSNIFVKGEMRNTMKYICNYNSDKDNKLLECPKCHNEEILDGSYCKICGFELFNRCTNFETDDFGNIVGGCAEICDTNARYCHKCGFKTTFFENGLLCNYKDYKEPIDNTHKKMWNERVQTLKSEGQIMLYTNLINTDLLEIDDNTIGINYADGLGAFTKTIITKEDNKNFIKKMIKDIYGVEKIIKFYDKSVDTEPNILDDGLPF